MIPRGGHGSKGAKLTASGAAANDVFGESVGLSGSTAIVGARLDSDAGPQSGSAYIFSDLGAQQAVIPEPASMSLLALGLLALRRRRSSSAARE